MMLKNYLKIFFRLFLKQTAFTLINILGLAVGLAACIIIALFVRHELSFDRYHANADNLYRINVVTTDATGEEQEEANAFLPLATLLADNFSAITDVARMDARVSLIDGGDSTFYENEFKLVDAAFFRLFDVVWLEGAADSALTAATDVVLSRSAAQKYFGDAPALGQSLAMAEGPVLRVNGVIEDLPANTHLSGTIFANMALRNELESVDSATYWDSTEVYTYVSLQPDVDVEQFRQDLDAFARTNVPQPANTTITLRLKPVPDIHMNYVLGDWPGKPQGDKLTLAAFSAIGIGILLIACVNFVNLGTARAAQRFGEVGLRLTLGARRTQLLAQFLSESLLFVLLAIVVALTLVDLTLPGIQALLGLNLAFDNFTDPSGLSALLGAGLVLGLLAGWYPAAVMSGHKAAAALKDPSRLNVRGLALKNVLVILQFAIAIGMLIAAVVIYAQMRFAGKLDLGYVTDNIVFIVTDDRGDSLGRAQVLKVSLQQGTRVAAVSLAAGPPNQLTGLALVTAEGAETPLRLAYYDVDFDYFGFYEITLLSGRLPAENRPADLVRTSTAGRAEQMSGSYVINENAAREFGWSAEEAVGKTLIRDGMRFQVIGVVEDTLQSARSPARPSIFGVPEDRNGWRGVMVKLDGSDLAAGTEFIERTWNAVNPGEPMTSISMNELVELNYQRERKLESLIFLFAGTAVFISCMGLFGLANFSAQRRTKEIGIRKVMGSSVWRIVVLFTNDFSKLVLLSNLVAWPAAYIVMNGWLENFAHRIDLTPLIFIGSGLIALCIAWATVGGTAAKAANQKPVLALRYE